MFICGIGRTKFGNISKSLPELAYDAMLDAIYDSPLSISDIDMILVSNFLGGPLNGQLHLNSQIASLIPGMHIPIIRIETACASGGVALNQAKYCLSHYENVLIVGVEKMTGVNLMPITDSIAMAEDCQFDKKNGLIFPAAYALIAQCYMSKYGIEHDVLEKISYNNHKNANLNPLAHFYNKEVTFEMIKNSPMVSDPLNLFDCSPISDGAAAVVVSNKRRTDRDIKVLSTQISTDVISLSEREDLTSFTATKTAANRAYAEARIAPKDIDILEIHDCFTISELIALEDLGMCKPGEAYMLVENEEISLNGRIPVNTDGGLKANGHPIGATGLAQLYEIVIQLRYEAGDRQIEKPEIGLAQNIGGIGGTCSVTVMEG